MVDRPLRCTGLGPTQPVRVGQSSLGGTAFLAARSALTHACEITCEVMLLHGRQDERAQLSQAERFSQAITAAGAEASLHVFDCGHRIPRVQLDPVLCPFLRKIFDPATRLH